MFNPMKGHLAGKAWVFGDHIDTDVITPGKYENLPFPQMCNHCLEPLDPSFAGGVTPGDIIVAGENFGCGSAREIAPRALKALGVSAIIAKSFSRTFFRNAVAIGLPILVSQGAAAACRPKDALDIDMTGQCIRNITSGAKISFDPIPPRLIRIIDAGGLFASLRNAKTPSARWTRRSKGRP